MSHLCPTFECARSHLLPNGDLDFTGEHPETPPQVSSPGSVDLGAAEDHQYQVIVTAGPQTASLVNLDLSDAYAKAQEIHHLRQLVVQLSRVYYDQDDALIAGLHTALSSDNWPEWAELPEDDGWSLNRGGADPAALGGSVDLRATDDGLAEVQRQMDMILSMALGGIRGLFTIGCPRWCYDGGQSVQLDLADFDDAGEQTCPVCNSTVRINRETIHIEVGLT